MELLLAAVAVSFIVAGLAAARGALPSLPSSKPSAPTDTSKSRPRAQLVPTPGKPQSAARVRELEAELRAVWPEVTGLSTPMPEGAVEIACAQALMEGCAAWGHYNYGCYQCSKGSQGGATYTCEVHQDSSPNADGSQTTFNVGFRAYNNPRDGARDFLDSIVKKFGGVQGLQAGSAIDFARQIYLNGYFGGFNPETPQGGGFKDWPTKWATTIAYLKSLPGLPERAAKVKASEDQAAGRIALYALGIGKRLPEVAAALDHSTVAAYLPADLA